MRTHIVRLARCKRGATAIEYGLIAACVAVAAIGGMRSLGVSVQSLWSNVSSNYSAVASA